MITNEQLLPFVNYDFDKNCKSEEDVKIKFVVKLFERLGHQIENMFFESNQRDIHIKYGRDIADIVIEVKPYTKKDWCSAEHIAQLAQYCKYCNKHKSTVAILTNGKELRIYYPNWEDRQQFRDKLVVTLNNQNLIKQKQILEDFLSYEYLTKNSLKQNISKYTYFHIEKAEILDYANYYGLIKQEQIIFCTRRPYSLNLILMCSSTKTNKEYKLSPRGQVFVNNLKENFNGSYYFARVEVITPKCKIPLEMWERLCKAEKIFPFWDSKGGPYKFFKRGNANIALCRVYEMRTKINRKDLGGGRAKQYLINPRKLEEINTNREEWRPLMNEEEYQLKRRQLMDIIGKYVL